MPRQLVILAVLLLIAGSNVNARAQSRGHHTDEAKVPKYELPELLVTDAGEKVTSKKQWESQRRGEVLELFRREMYGRLPKDLLDTKVRAAVLEEDEKALGGTAIRKQVRLTFGSGDKAPHMDVLIYLPANAKGPAPIFVGLNFRGNHTTQDDPKIFLPTSWVPNDKRTGAVDNQASEKGRGVRSSRWPVEDLLKRGYGLATVYCGDIDPDYHDGFKNGVHVLQNGKHKADDWGAISAWAWGLSRALDYFETEDAIDKNRVAVIGHSRLGKTSLWAGAQDTRFAMVVSNNSGCGGAALSKRAFGETVKIITSRFQHWFCGNFTKYGDKEADLPLDQHMLMALMAPRPLYIASATEDLWADPRGEFLSGKGANPVYKLYGKVGLPAEERPEPDTPVMGDIGYHIRTGRHDITAYDWQQYMNFADKHFGRKK